MYTLQTYPLKQFYCTIDIVYDILIFYKFQIILHHVHANGNIHYKYYDAAHISIILSNLSGHS